MDPHFMKQELFGVPGKIMEDRGRGEEYVLCTNTHGPPHSLCNMVKEEKKKCEEVITAGEYGRRDNLGKARLGFTFSESKESVKIEKRKVAEDLVLKRKAFMGEKTAQDSISSESLWLKEKKEEQDYLSWCAGKLYNIHHLTHTSL